MTVIVFAALVWQVIDFLRELVNFRTQGSAILTQLTAWVGGIVLVALAAHAAVTAGLVLPGADMPLGKLDFGSVVILGMLISSLASSSVDLKQAFDRTDSAAKPPLVPPAPATTTVSPPAATG